MLRDGVPFTRAPGTAYEFLVDERHPGGGATIRCGAGLGCNQFLVLRVGNALQFQLTPTPVGDADNEFFTAGGTIAELISPDSQLNISGTGLWCAGERAH